MNRAEITLNSIDKMQQSHLAYLGNSNGTLGIVGVFSSSQVHQLISLFNPSLFCLDASGLLRAVTQFSHLAADTIVNGSATSHSAPVDQANCKKRT